LGQLDRRPLGLTANDVHRWWSITGKQYNVEEIFRFTHHFLVIPIGTSRGGS